MKYFIRMLFSVLAVVAVLAGTSVSAESIKNVDIRPAVMDRAEQFDITSKFSNQDYRIKVALPSSYALTDKEYRVVYVLDSFFSFGVVHGMDTVNMGLTTENIYVAIGYVRPNETPINRNHDMSPKGSQAQEFLDQMNSASTLWHQQTENTGVEAMMKAALSTKKKYTQGGADDFLAFIEKELDPVIRKHYRTNDGKAGLMGVSMGGLFTYYAFLKQSPLFDRFFIGSPGLQLPNSKLLDGLPELLRSTDFKDQRVFLAAGSEELINPFFEALAMNFLKMGQIFSQNPADGLSVEYRVYSGKTHTTVTPVAMQEAAEYLFKP
ncbi:MAG: alpha/beta hydrolase-fold protein [Gammaproteobacteria bacterium]|jgi:hypothetical protein|nr:alpha/beta hydrolase-fold protein [Gammaproteobacteria bacterium]